MQEDNSKRINNTIPLSIFDKFDRFSVLVIDKEYKIHYYNERLAEEVRHLYDIESPLTALEDIFIHSSNDHETALKFWNKALNGETSVVKDSYGTVNTRTYEVWFFPYRLNDKQYACCATFNVSEEERKLKIVEKENAVKREFLSRMSHELRTPLNSILGFAELMRMSVDEEPYNNYLTQISRAGKYLLELINEVLDITKIESGKMHVSMEPINFINCIDEVIDTHGAGILEKKMIVNKQYARKFYKMRVHADQQKFKQTVTNLISNAVKFGKYKGKIMIDVREMDGYIKFSISDDGRGISKANVKKLFQPFERLGVTDVDGTGLGLTLAKKFVEAMGGEIGCETELGKGTTFWFSLKIAHGNDIVGAPDSEQKDAIYQMLYIEDNTANHDLMESIMTLRPNVKLIKAFNSEDGYELTLHLKPHLILLDVHLTDGCSDKFYIKMKRSDDLKDIPVIVLSADATNSQIKYFKTLGVQDYVAKPIDIRNLLSIIDKYLPDGQ